MSGSNGNVVIEGLDDQNRGAGIGTAQADGPVQPLGVVELMNLALETPTHLSNEGKLYSETILERLVKAVPAAKVERIASPSYECHVFHAGKVAVALLFAESYNSIDARPPACMAKEIRQKFALAVSDAEITQVIVVTKEMYPRVDRAGAAIINLFRSLTEPRLVNMTAKQYGGTEYAVTSDMQKVRSFIDVHSPHAVPARDDVGFLVYAKVRKAGVTTTFDQRAQYDLIPLIAVTGYTKFYLTANASIAPGNVQFGTTKYSPMTVITDIVADLLTAPTLAIGLSIAMDAFIMQYGWLNQFNDYSENGYNIGRLILDPETKKPWIARNQQQRDEFMRNYLNSTMPFLALDIQEGRFRNPMIDRLINDPATIINALSTFSGQQLAAVDPAIARYPQFDGQVTLGSTQTIDTRCIDYLRMAKDIPNVEELGGFLQQPTDMSSGIAQVQKWYPNTTQSLYLTMRLVLRPDFVNTVANAIRNVVRIEYDFNNQQASYNISSLLTSGANNYQGFNSFTTAGGVNSWNGNNFGW